jgi:hypothetical protein
MDGGALAGDGIPGKAPLVVYAVIVYVAIL